LSQSYNVRLSPKVLRNYWALVVDDNPTNLYLMETILQSIGLPYMTAANGRDALEKTREFRFDLIFMDIQMPVMDGYTAIREIRRLESAATTQIIALTASALQEDIERALGAGSTGFLAKPFERNQLLLCIAEHLGVTPERELRPAPDLSETPDELAARQMYDFMREQYQVSIGEIKMILAQAVTNWRPKLDDLLILSRRGDWEAVRTLLHDLKGQLGAIGLSRFAAAADQLGVQIRTGDVTDAEAQLQEYARDLSAIFRVVEQQTTQVGARVREADRPAVAPEAARDGAAGATDGA
jgi:CheY-like chemotaxis protein